MDVADKLNKAVRYFRDDGYRFRVNAAHGVYRNMPDEEYIRRMFRAKMGAEPDLESPRTFNEKMQWLKLHDRKPIYTVMVDKYAAKQFAADIIGQEHIIPNLGVWDRAEDVDFDALPEQFVIKCTHDSHGLVICRDKSALDESAAREKLAQGLKRDYYLALREWPYKNVPHRIIAEPYLEDTDKPGELTDYKIHCFNAEPRIIQVITDRFSPGGMINDHYSLDWEKLKLGRGRHTTRHAELYKLSGGGYIADTPGFSTFETNRYDIIRKEELAGCFREFDGLTDKCRFRDCAHLCEKGCAVVEAVERGEISGSRHESYKTMYEEAKQLKEWELK